MKNLIARFVKDESGATAIEYGLIAAGISLAIIAVVNGIGSSLNTIQLLRVCLEGNEGEVRNFMRSLR